MWRHTAGTDAGAETDEAGGGGECGGIVTGELLLRGGECDRGWLAVTQALFVQARGSRS